MIHLWLEVTVSGDYWLKNTIHMDTIHSVIALPPASFTTPSFYLSQKLHCVESRNDPSSFVWTMHRLLCCVFYFTWTHPIKIEVNFFLCSWRWHIQGGTALHQFLIVASDVGEWSDMLQPLFHQTKNSWYHWMWCWVGLWTSLNVL